MHETSARTSFPSPQEGQLSSFLHRSIPRYLAHAPIALCLRELNRLAAVQWIADRTEGLKGPILDVGCGDGFWWTFLERSGCEVYGIDISSSELRQAARVLDHVEIADVSTTRVFPDVEFQGIIGNCSLEHVPDVNGALRNLRRCAAPGARLILFVPTPTWALQGRTQTFLMRRFPRIAMAIAGALNGFFQHWHLYHHGAWGSLLENNGWTVRRVVGLGGRRSEFLFRLSLPFAFMSFLVKQVTGVYPSKLLQYLPSFALRPVVNLVESSLRSPFVDPDDPGAYEYMIVARAGTGAGPDDGL